MLITADTKIYDALITHPELKPVLLALNPKHEKLNNSALFQTVGRWARMRDVARVGGTSLCTLLHALNGALGQEEELLAVFPDCIEESAQAEMEPARPRGRASLSVLSNSTEPAPRSTPDAPRAPWFERRDAFEQLDVLGMSVDPFERIMSLAQDITLGHGFTLVQSFLPTPLITMLAGMGFEHEAEPLGPGLFHIHFFLPVTDEEEATPGEDTRVGVVVQSATPVVWPVLMRMMQSERLRARVRFDQVKVWDRTEKHMGWLVKGKADVTFSAVVAAARLYAGGVDIRLASVDVWDNFHLVSRAPHPRSLSDLKGRSLRLPLVKTAPPYAVSSYLIKAEGAEVQDLDFDFGRTFDPPEAIKDAFLRGEHDAVLLREPEASYALHGAGGEAEALSYRDLWTALHPAEGDLPNAGLVFKGEFLREHPQEARLILEETRAAVLWVTEHRQEAAELAWDIMGHSKEEVSLFLERVHLEHRPASELRGLLGHYLQVLVDEGGMALKGSVEDALGILVELDE